MGRKAKVIVPNTNVILSWASNKGSWEDNMVAHTGGQAGKAGKIRYGGRWGGACTHRQ